MCIRDSSYTVCVSDLWMCSTICGLLVTSTILRRAACSAQAAEGRGRCDDELRAALSARRWPLRVPPDLTALHTHTAAWCLATS